MIVTTLLVPTNVSSATVAACAKINLTLDVLGRRDDGYHELRSLVVGVDLCDTVRCHPLDRPQLVVDCSESSLAGRDNLAYQAALEFAGHCGIDPALRIELDKVIPVGGGLGGGSSDAAATLRVCNHVWNAGLDRAELSRLGARLGSDVPLFFFLPSAVVTGRGEQVEPVSLCWSGWVLLIMAGPGVPTAEVYRAWRHTDTARLPADMDREVCAAAGAEELSGLLTNHLEAAVFRVSPRVARVYDELNRAGFGPLRVSGAG